MISPGDFIRTNSKSLLSLHQQINRMIYFPNTKINIGLFVTEKRKDGFHNLETVFYPLGLSDILEVKRIEDGVEGTCLFENTGILVDCPVEKNLVLKAYHLLAKDFRLPAVKVRLRKIVPFGAGLGGGSSDAAFMLKALNEGCELGLSENKLMEYASQLGSDCAFFILNRPAFASGKGEQLEEITLSLNDYRLVLVKPDCGVSTAEAYRGIVPAPIEFDLRKIGTLPVEEWKQVVKNDFEAVVFARYPEIGNLKEYLYEQGAVYAAMTGSGSAVFGLFPKNGEEISIDCPGCFVWKEE